MNMSPAVDAPSLAPSWWRRHVVPGAGSSGQATVEFALASMMFLTMIFGTLDFGRVIFVKAELSNAVREGARIGRFSPTNTTAIKTAVVDHAVGTGLTSSNVTVSCTGTCTAGTDRVTVKASITFTAITQNLLGLKPIPLNVEATVDVE